MQHNPTRHRSAAVAAMLSALVLMVSPYPFARPSPAAAAAAATVVNRFLYDQAGVNAAATGPGGVNHLLIWADGPSMQPPEYITDATGAWVGSNLQGAPGAGDIAVDAAGHVFIVTTGTSATYPSAFLYLTTNVTGTLVAHPLNGSTFGPIATQIAVADNGDVFVAWQEAWLDHTFYAKYSNGAWGDPIEIAPTLIPRASSAYSDGSLRDFDVVVDSSNTPHFIVAGEMPGLPQALPCDWRRCIAEFTPDGIGGWTVERIYARVGRLDARRNGSDGIVVSVTQTQDGSSPNDPVAVLTRSAGAWSSQVLTGSIAGDVAPIRVGPNGLAVFYHDVNGSDRRIRRADRGASSWTTTILPYSAEHVSADVDSSNAAHIAYDVGKFYPTSGGQSLATWIAAPDTRAPSITKQLQRPTSGAKTTSSVPVTISWTAADALSGIARYELQERIGTGLWTSVSASLTTASKTVNITSGGGATVYQFRVRATDKSGNVSGWVSGTSFTLAWYQNTSSLITYGGTWSTSTSSKYSGGNDRYTSTKNRSAQMTFTGRSVGWLAATGPTRGMAQVFIDGVWNADINLHASATTYKKIVFSWVSATNGTHTFKIVDLGTSGHARIDLDSVLVIR